MREIAALSTLYIANLRIMTVIDSSLPYNLDQIYECVVKVSHTLAIYIYEIAISLKFEFFPFFRERVEKLESRFCTSNRIELTYCVLRIEPIPNATCDG